MFLLLGTFGLWTYTIVPDLQTTLVAMQTGVNKEQIKNLWIVGLLGTGVLFYLLYSEGELPK